MAKTKPKTSALKLLGVTIKQVGGNDGYCWAVLIDGKVKWDGMTKSEAKWRRDKERAALMQR